MKAVMKNPQHVFLFYARDADTTSRSAQHLLEQIHGATEVYRTLQSLTARLKQSVHDIIGAVVVPGDKDELEELIAMEELLADVAIVIVLGAADRELISLCHRLHPRMIIEPDDNETMQAVLGTLYRRHCKGPAEKPVDFSERRS